MRNQVRSTSDRSCTSRVTARPFACLGAFRAPSVRPPGCYISDRPFDQATYPAGDDLADGGAIAIRHGVDVRRDIARESYLDAHDGRGGIRRQARSSSTGGQRRPRLLTFRHRISLSSSMRPGGVGQTPLAGSA